MGHETTTIVSDTLESLAYSTYNLMVLSGLEMLTEKEIKLVDKLMTALYEFDPKWVSEFGVDLYIELDDFMDDENED